MSRSPWILASRPATLWAGVAPVVVGTALAVADDEFSWNVFAAALIVALAVQIGVNFANDLADAKSGADDDNRIGPTRAVAAGLLSARAMRNGIAIAFGTAAAAGGYLAAIAGPVVLVIGAACFVAAIGYTAGPYPYGYRGLGELFVFVFFGLVATVGTRYVFDETAPAAAWWAGSAMGLLASAILVANNVRDIDTDRAAGKRTLAVIVGRVWARRLYAATVYGAFGAVVAGVAVDALPRTALVTLGGLLLALAPMRAVYTRVDGPGLIAALEATARLQIVTAALLSLAVIV